MKAQLEIKGKTFEVDFSKGKDISISLLFNGSQPNTYNVEKAISRPYSDGQFIGDTRKGGPCNFETYTITPHCNGTHTKCIGPITDERMTRFNISLQQGVEMVLWSLENALGGELFVPKIPSYRITDVDEAIGPSCLKIFLAASSPFSAMTMRSGSLSSPRSSASCSVRCPA